MGYTGGNATGHQGQPEYEALVGRQEAEIRMLEVMRRCVTSKLKCDREYAASLSALCAQGYKCGGAGVVVVGGGGANVGGGGNVGCGGDTTPGGGSLVAGAWRRLLDELDVASRAIRAVCDRIEKHTLDRIASICAEKRKAKKAYQDEYNRISSQYNNVSGRYVFDYSARPLLLKAHGLFVVRCFRFCRKSAFSRADTPEAGKTKRSPPIKTVVPSVVGETRSSISRTFGFGYSRGHAVVPNLSPNRIY